ncbi:3-isopropylmalate dehydratase small subunit [Bordetella genomosp. 12]|uniref:3-isopropylmalate dehydratase n=1 Tax=Bordetella genomosp. 12 TaxID=463035 RepID=A0A261VFF1_9BORD|nr:3-isopropylmalate dehydratase small subunit [Bordetella genomosp. 12]OZI71883.1 3-isopropylmalate dehydratase small subunit [Bordetella genomosp. 12]
MHKVTVIRSRAAPLLRSNVDTDTIIRIERLMHVPREELGRYALEALRLRDDGSEEPGCVLNQPPFREASILLTGDNFGCGSSREGAVWALMGCGLRCVIAPSFGEIFYNNCFQNGMLPVRLPADAIGQLAAQAGTQEVIVDLRAQTVSAGELCFRFEIEPMRREALLEGLDAVTDTLRRGERIAAWQQADRQARPWVWPPFG